MNKLFFIILCFVSTLIKANDYKEIINVIKYVETLNNPELIGDNGDSYGVLQIQKKCVDDVNRYYNTHYTHEDMFRIECAEEVTLLYMKMGEELYFKKYGECPTEEVLVRNHNGGIYKGYKTKATIKYYNKYLIFKNKLKQ